MPKITWLFLFCFFSLTSLVAYDVVCIGSSIVDYTVTVTEEWLKNSGAEKGGVKSLSVAEFDNCLHSLMLLSKTMPPMIKAGGSAGTSVKGLGQLGCSAAFLSRSGDDDNGYFIRSVLKENHVDAYGPMLPGKTARVLCGITSDGQRTFFFVVGTTGTPKAEDLIEELFQKTTIVHIEGYVLRDKKFLKKIIFYARKYK